MIALFCGCGQGGAGGFGLAKVESNSQDIVDVDHSTVERQSIGNCWLYAESGWAEAMYQQVTGAEIDISESYWTYLHWFDQISSPYMRGDEINAGGSWYTARSIVRKYGLMREADFIATDSDQEKSLRQAEAEGAINEALAEGGELATAAARRDRATVRRVMDEAWDLPQQVRSQLDQVFGHSLDNNFLSSASAAGTPIMHAADLPASYTVGSYTSTGSLASEQTLSSALNEWRSVNYPSSSAERRRVMRRMQRAAHDLQPVIITWLVDFNALEYRDNERRGSFNLQTLEQAGEPGRQGGHLTLLEDYEAIVPSSSEVVEESGRVAKDRWMHFGPFTVAMAADAEVSMTGSGDADLYVRVGSQPDSDNYDCRPYSSGSVENCTVSGPGDLYVSVKGYATDSSFSVKVALLGDKEVLAADVTLDPNDPDDRAKLEAALSASAAVVFLRIKNSWGANRGGLPFAPGPHDDSGVLEKGYHDLYMDYLHGPIADADNCSESSCPKTIAPLYHFTLPPGY